MFAAVLLLVPVASGQADLGQRLEQAAALIRENRLDKAEEELHAILKSQPRQADALNLLGAIRAQQGNLLAAERLFSLAIRSNSQLISARANLAQLYLIKGQPNKTILELTEILRLEPGNEEAVDKLARLLLSQNRIEEFIALLNQTARTRPLSTSLLVLLGDVYLKKRNADQAQTSYEQVLNQQSDNADALLGMAQVAQFRGDEVRASDYIARAKKAASNSPDTLYRFALVSIRAGNYEEANIALTEALKLKPSEPDYLILLGTTWLKKPDLFEAERAFRRALELRPNDGKIELNLGYTLLEQKKYPEAKALLAKSLANDPRVPETYYYLGLIAQEESDDAQAILYFKKVIQLLPSYAAAHLGMGSSFLKLRDYARAQAELELAAKLDPTDSRAHYQLALLFARLKNSERAQQEMEIVERLKNQPKAQKPNVSP
jgi:tetratricopeptide (TPR) repeat protein